MFLESFRHIIEIEALKRENALNYQRIKSEEKRIYDLDLLRQKAELRLSQIPDEIKSLQLTSKQNNVEALSSRLTQLNHQQLLAKNQKEEELFLSQISHTSNELSQLEEDFFSCLEKSEQLENEIKEINIFLKGSLQTKNELLLEVKLQVEIEQKSIANRTLRINSLTEELNENVRKIYLETEKRLQPKQTITFLQEKKCSTCFISIDSFLRQSLEEGKSVEQCPNCSRLLIPDSCRI